MAADRKWADFELDDDVDLTDAGMTPSGFESKLDEHGIKTSMNYVNTAHGELVKVVKRVRVTKKITRIKKEVHTRSNIPYFGLELYVDKDSGSSAVQSHEDYTIEVPKRFGQIYRHTEDEDDEDMQFADLNLQKHSRDLRQKFKLLQEEGEPVDLNLDGAQGLTKCVPRVRRDGLESKEFDRRRDECTVRVTNLSEDVKDEDLQLLFGTVGKIERVYLAKHKEKKCSKGFAFVTYTNREDASRAIRQLNRHGYDNLLLNVEWARPSNRDRA